jgi:hypothetical protein
MDKHYFEVAASTTPYYFDGLRFYDSYEYGFRASSGMNYAIFLRCEFDTLTTGRAINGNQGFYFAIKEGTGSYLAFQDCIFHDYTGVAGIGSLYNQNKMLVEDCYFYNQYNGANPDVCTAIAPKENVSNSTFRKNRVVISQSTAIGGGNGGFHTSSNNEICFNYFNNTAGGEVDNFNHAGDQEITYYYRNTAVGTIMLKFINADGYSDGPFVFENNVVINNASGLTYHYTCGPNPQNYVTFTNNLTGTPTSRIVDSNGNLADSYSQYIGTRGWQIGNPVNTDSLPPTAPSGISIIIND